MEQTLPYPLSGLLLVRERRLISCRSGNARLAILTEPVPRCRTSQSDVTVEMAAICTLGGSRVGEESIAQQ